ncbi:MAG: hypothetical protein HY817_04860 [Candidatus Abawacabacteria bacterium]|nr:hypothetical protein [Candidatus Abawacabacteria bacterium]
MYTRGILERYADSLPDEDQKRFRAAIALILFEGEGDQATCGGAAVTQMLQLPALHHLVDDFQSRWFLFLRQEDLQGLGATVRLQGDEPETQGQ